MKGWRYWLIVIGFKVFILSCFLAGMYFTPMLIPTWVSTGGGELHMDGFYYRTMGGGQEVIVGPSHHPDEFTKIGFCLIGGLLCAVFGLLSGAFLLKCFGLDPNVYLE